MANMLRKQAVCSPRVQNAGSLEWWHPSKARPLGQVVNILVNHMEQAGWRSWLVSDGLNYPLMVELTAYSLCNMPLARSFELRPSTWSGGAVTLEHLERDGVVQLVSTGMLCDVPFANDDALPSLMKRKKDSSSRPGRPLLSWLTMCQACMQSMTCLAAARRGCVVGELSACMDTHGRRGYTLRRMQTKRG